MKLPEILAFFLLLVSGVAANAQEPEIIEGDFSVLAKQDQIKLEFNYSGMTVGKYHHQIDFLRALQRQEKPGSKAVEPRLQDAWQAARDTLYETRFLEALKGELKGQGPTMARNLNEAPLTLVVKSIHTQPGLKEKEGPTSLRLEYMLVDTPSQRNQLGRYYHRDIRGPSFNSDLYQSIAEAYAAAGKALGQAIRSAEVK